MSPQAIRISRLPDEPPGQLVPLVKTVVATACKRGVSKTSLTVAITERLSWVREAAPVLEGPLRAGLRR